MSTTGDPTTTERAEVRSAENASDGQTAAPPADSASSTSAPASTHPAPPPSGPEDSSIEVSFEELDEEIVLDGRGASKDEIRRAQHTVDLLSGIVPRLTDTTDAAHVSFEIGTLLGGPLDEPEAALEAMREAYRQCPSSLALARGYRKAAMRAGDIRELVSALENEAKRIPSKSGRAQLTIERARLLEFELDNPEAARFSYAQSLETEPRAEALEALERLAATSGELERAAGFAQQLANLVTDVAIRAEHLARAARHLHRAGNLRDALALAVQAQVHNPASPAISFTLERLLLADSALPELANLRERQIEAGIIDAACGWFDVGVIATVSFGDLERASRAFRAAADAATPAQATAALEQLAIVLERRKKWTEVVSVRREILEHCDESEKADLWLRIAIIHDEHLDDPDRAAAAYDEALSRDPTCRRALAGAGRLLQRRAKTPDRHNQLIAMHRREAEAATTKLVRGHALRRIGALLLEEEATLDEGLKTLRQALEALPGNLTVLSALERGLRKKRAWKMLVDLYEHQLDLEEEPARRGWLLAQMGLIASQLGDTNRATAALKQHMDLAQPHPPVPLMQLAELLEGSDAEGDHEAYVLALSRIAQHEGGAAHRADILLRIAGAQERAEDHDAAISTYEEAIEAAPPGHPVYVEAGRVFMTNARHAEHVKVLLAGSRCGDDSERAHWLVRAAEVMDRHLDRVEDAVDALHSARALDPNSEATSLLVEIHLRNGQFEDLVALLDEAGGSVPDTTLWPAVIAESLEDDRAVARYERALDSGQTLAWLPYARLAAQQGLWDELATRYHTLATQETAPTTVRHHAAYRAGEIALERLEDVERAAAGFSLSHQTDKTAIAPLIALAPITTDEEQRVDLVASLQASTRDKATRLTCLRHRIAALDELEREDEALDARMDVLRQDPSEPWVLTEVELTLEQRGDRLALADVLREACAAPQLEPSLRSSMQAELGMVLEQLGLLREAVEAYEEASTDSRPKSRLTLLALRRCYDAIEDDRVGQVLAALASCPPRGPEQALARRALAWWWVERGDSSAAIGALEDALRAHPLDYDALNDLIEVAEDSADPRITDAMLRAFELEEDPTRRKRVGLAVSTRLLRRGRVDGARECVDRMLDDDPRDLRVLMLNADILEQRKSWPRTVSALESIVAHEGAPPAVVVEALLRLVSIHNTQLGDPVKAKAATKRILSLDASGDLSADVRLDVEEALGDYAAAAASLEELVHDPELTDEERAPLLLRLSALHEVHLDDPKAALDALARITDTKGREQVATRLFALGERTGRWDLASKALEATLESEETLDPVWEAALRRRLGDLLHKHLSQPENAFKHYERVIELEPDDTLTLQALAEISTAQSSEHAIAFHRRLLEVEPLRVSSYRALRQLFLEADNTDGAYCAEAMLVGLNAANDEERYFYRQRRMNTTQKLVAKLNDEELDLLFPERSDPVFALMASLEPFMRAIFGVDRAAYGLDDEEEEERAPSRIITPIAKAVAYLLGVDQFELRTISDRMVATSELGTPPLVLVPRALEDALRREQQFVCGAVLGRIRFGGSAADAGRATALTTQQIEHTLTAALVLAGSDDVRPPSGAIYADIEARVRRALDDESADAKAKARVLERARAYAKSGTVGGADVESAYRRAAVRTAFLCAQDPSVAVRCLNMYGKLFDAGGESDSPAPPAQAVLPFSVSAAHLRLRRRLAGDVKGAGDVKAAGDVKGKS